MSWKPLQCLVLLSMATTGCTPSQPTKPEQEKPALLSKGGRLPLRDGGNDALCGSASENDSMAAEGGPPPPAGFQPTDLPEEEGGVVYNAAVARALALIYINAIFDVDLLPHVHPPLRARLGRGIWYVSGPPIAEGHVGGEFYLQICQSNGRLLKYVATQLTKVCCRPIADIRCFRPASLIN